MSKLCFRDPGFGSEIVLSGFELVDLFWQRLN